MISNNATAVWNVPHKMRDIYSGNEKWPKLQRNILMRTYPSYANSLMKLWIKKSLTWNLSWQNVLLRFDKKIHWLYLNLAKWPAIQAVREFSGTLNVFVFALSFCLLPLAVQQRSHLMQSWCDEQLYCWFDLIWYDLIWYAFIRNFTVLT